MRMNRMAALAGAGVAVAFLAACSDSPSGPQQRSAFVPRSSFAVGDVTTSTPEVTLVKVCKSADSDVGGSFSVVVDQAGTGGTGNPTFSNPQTVAVGQCKVVAIDAGDANFSIGDWFHVTEAAQTNVTETQLSCTETGGPVDCASFFVNSAHGVTVTWKNTNNAVTGCTFTKGWYRNNGANTITGADGLSLAVEGAFFAATPNKTGTVSFVGSNDLLNLYQQLLAAIENGGTGGPGAVQTAITDAKAGTTVTGTVLTTTLTQAQISALITTLSNFNEGLLPGWPHCP
jgi:hypothetical protein